MKSLGVWLALVGTLALGCNATPKVKGAETGFRYLGLPADEEYPQTAFQLDKRVLANKYYRVSRLSHVTKDQYDHDAASGRMQFRERHGEAEFYATEFNGDFDQQSGVRAWVTILERKVYP
jgi:hypothetical protein